eukprot:5854438-Prymnesium_polylepis.1
MRAAAVSMRVREGRAHPLRGRWQSASHQTPAGTRRSDAWERRAWEGRAWEGRAWEWDEWEG